MLSFFTKKKHSPETPPGDIIRGPSDGQEEDFTIIGEPPGGPNPSNVRNAAPTMPLYPYPPASYGLPSTTNYYPANVNQNPVSYVLGIPFNLSPQLSNKTSFEVTQMEVDGILALMTKQMQFENDYDFKLERGILSECY